MLRRVGFPAILALVVVVAASPTLSGELTMNFENGTSGTHSVTFYPDGSATAVTGFSFIDSGEAHFADTALGEGHLYPTINELCGLPAGRSTQVANMV